MNKDEAEKLREKRVQECAADLMREGGEYYPFGVKNFTEALQNFSDENYRLLAVSAAIRANEPLIGMATEYWRKIALAEAERLVACVEDYVRR